MSQKSKKRKVAKGGKAVILIPARWKSTRFPGKPLHLIEGKPLVQHVWERCLLSKEADRVIVATDDMKIARAAFDFGAEVAMTSSKHPTGTDRIAQVAAELKSFPIIMNIQGDEPLVDPKLIDRIIRTLREDRNLSMVTAAVLRERDSIQDSSKVKVVTDRTGNALYFSRSEIPFCRDVAEKSPVLHHFGIYGYRRKFLLEFVRWKQSPLEKLEMLEQLRALEHGVAIRVLLAKQYSPGVDTPEDAAETAKMLRCADSIGKKRPAH